jgi:hypothetical protein
MDHTDMKTEEALHTERVFFEYTQLWGGGGHDYVDLILAEVGTRYFPQVRQFFFHGSISINR